MSGIRIETDLGTITSAIKAKLLADNVFGRVLISTNPITLKTPPSDQYAVLVPGRQTYHQPAIMGGGRSLLQVDGRINVVIWTRLMLDENNEDALFLTDAALGALAKYNAVLNSLTLFDPLDGKNDFILGEPMRPLDAEDAKKTNLPGWGYMTVAFEIMYAQTLT